MLAQGQETNAFVSELGAAEFAILRSHLVPVDLHAGDRLHRQGVPVDDVIFPQSGLVGLTMPLHDGLGAVVALIGSDGIVGAISAAASAPASSDALVHIGGQGLRMSAVAFRHVLDQNPAIRRRVARHASAMLAQVQQTALCHANHAVESRICRWLLEVHDRTGGNKVPLTQGTLAQMLGVRRTTVTLVAGRLEAAGVLYCRRGYLQIVSQGELARHSCDCYAHVRSYMANLRSAPGEAAAVRAADAMPAGGWAM
ncbi:MAG: Crp/Fnr family transcriptional regulator [Xanthobacteraceae bacterium]